MASPAQVGISVVVCTFNRAGLLARTLASLVDQTCLPETYEIVVVNNASTDQTAHVVGRFQQDHARHRIRLVEEARAGLGYARNTGWQSASAPIVAYIDDDALAPRHWIATILRTFDSLAPVPVCVGGPVDVRYDSPKPAWFKDEYEILTWGDEPRWLKPREVLAGGNMAWQRAVLEAYSGFDVDKGVSGDLLSLGEETWLFYRVWDSPNNHFYYTPELPVYHLVAPKKLSVRYQLARAFVAGQVRAQENVRTRRMTARQRASTALVKMSRLLPRLLRGLAQYRRYPHWQNWAIEVYASIAMDWGYVLRVLGIQLKIKQR